MQKNEYILYLKKTMGIISIFLSISIIFLSLIYLISLYTTFGNSSLGLNMENYLVLIITTVIIVILIAYIIKMTLKMISAVRKIKITKKIME
jgi:hypothetical protein